MNGAKSVRTMMEQGQNKLRYLQDLKEPVLKRDFENLKNEAQDIKTNLSSRFDLLGDLEKSNKLLLKWIEDTEGRIKKRCGILK